MKTLAVLGSTGSIGTQTLEIVRGAPDLLAVGALCAHSSWEALVKQALEFRPQVVGLSDPGAAERARAELPAEIHVLAGREAPEEIAAESDYDLLVHGIVGASGVKPSQRVLERGKTLALANKESLVVAGELLMEVSRRRGALVIPVDSEHAAIHQCLRGESVERVRRIYVTASGGPFRDTPIPELAHVTPAMALKHPNWEMGPRITVGSATLMNKALEVIEAHHLFGLDADRIRVLIHRQSIIHSMVEFVDGSILAQLGPPDMRGPIHYAIHYPEREPSDFQGFDAELFRKLTFEEVDPDRFPTLEMGFRCVREGGDAGAVLNAADEIGVQAFLDGEIGFQEIARVNRTVLEKRAGLHQSVDALLEADARARAQAREEVAQLAPPTTLRS